MCWLVQRRPVRQSAHFANECVGYHLVGNAERAADEKARRDTEPQENVHVVLVPELGRVAV